MRKATDTAKKGKAYGIDSNPVEVLCNVTSVSFLHILFNVCFDKGIVPSAWSKCIINPNPKSSTTDPRDPLSYRGITLASAMYKLYCSVINSRLSSWCGINNKIVDEQNGFRKNRSTIDHVSTLTNIIDSRKKRKLSTFCVFIDLTHYHLKEDLTIQSSFEAHYEHILCLKHQCFSTRCIKHMVFSLSLEAEPEFFRK